MEVTGGVVEAETFRPRNTNAMGYTLALDIVRMVRKYNISINILYKIIGFK